MYYIFFKNTKKQNPRLPRRQARALYGVGFGGFGGFAYAEATGFS
jgi:hypothetical protein